VCGGEKVITKNLALTAIFAALYAVLVIALAGISFQLVQVRVADALIPLSMVFGWPAVAGVTIGCVISNVVSPLPSVITDITLGALANFCASLTAWRIGLWKPQRASDMVVRVGSHLVTRDRLSHFLGCLAATLVVTFVVGTYLAVITTMELWIWWLGIGIGSLISICGIGYPLVEVLKRIQLH
jgi:uncharacterized membrane protein